jgi:hypothetical protein
LLPSRPIRQKGRRLLCSRREATLGFVASSALRPTRCGSIDVMDHTPVVIVLAWNRPLYLWACLDSLYFAGTSCDDLPVTRAVAPLLNGLPIGVDLSETDVDRVVSALTAAVAEQSTRVLPHEVVNVWP